MATQIGQLLEQAEYFDQLADQKDGYPRLEALRRIDELQREASAVKAAISHNENVLVRQRKELEQTREEAAAMIQRAEERVQETEQLVADQMAKLEELEGKQARAR